MTYDPGRYKYSSTQHNYIHQPPSPPPNSAHLPQHLYALARIERISTTSTTHNHQLFARRFQQRHAGHQEYHHQCKTDRAHGHPDYEQQRHVHARQNLPKISQPSPAITRHGPLAQTLHTEAQTSRLTERPSPKGGPLTLTQTHAPQHHNHRRTPRW